MIQILSAIDSSDHGTTVMDYTGFVAAALSARVAGLCVVESKKIEGPLLRDYLSTVGLDAGLDYKGAVKQFLELKSKELLEEFRGKCAELGIEFEAIVEHGIVTDVIEARAEEADLVILGRKGEHAEWHASPLGGAVEGILRSTRKPVLITPRRFREIGRALVAYDGSRYAREALDLATRISRATDLEGIVLSVQSDPDEEEAARTRREVEEILSESGCSYRFETRVGDPGKWIPVAAKQLECDLIIMGAYGHSKIREMILGSSTQQVLLNTSKLPVLLRR